MNAILIVAVTALVTIAVRFLPFAVFGKRPLPRAVVYLGRVLPPAWAWWAGWRGGDC